MMLIRCEDGVGYVIKIPNNISDEVGLELRTPSSKSEQSAIPTDLTHNFSVDYVWKSTSFDRMQHAMRTFAVNEQSVSGFLYHKLLGHDPQPQALKTQMPKRY